MAVFAEAFSRKSIFLWSWVFKKKVPLRKYENGLGFYVSMIVNDGVRLHKLAEALLHLPSHMSWESA